MRKFSLAVCTGKQIFFKKFPATTTAFTYTAEQHAPEEGIRKAAPRKRKKKHKKINASFFPSKGRLIVA